MDAMAEKELPAFKSADEMTEDELLNECFLDCEKKDTALTEEDMLNDLLTL